MAARSPVRFLAPLALLAFVLALFIVVTHSPSSDTSGGATKGRQEQTPSSAGDGGGTGAAKPKGKRFYRVKPGDTPSSIAEQAGVPLSQIEKLNPNLDPQTLAPGERIKLRP
jgi:LysM repeat protein